jgi:sugar phosphate permease
MHPKLIMCSSVKKDRVQNISLVILCRSFQTIAQGGIALFLPLIREAFGLSFTQAGALSAATILTYALMQIPAGFLSDRFGPRRLFFVGVLGTTILSLTFGLVSEYWQALSNQILSGFFRAVFFVSGLTLLAAWFPSNRLATAMALSLAAAYAGEMIMDIVGPLLVAQFNWRFPFIAFSSAGILVSFTFLRYSKDPPEASGHQRIGVREMSQFFRHKIVWLCALMQFIRLGVMQGIAFWLPSFLIEEKGLSLHLTGFVIAFRAMAIAPSSVLGAYTSDKIKNPTVVIGFSLIVLSVTTAWLVLAESSVILLSVIIVNAVFVQFYFGPLFSIPLETLGMRTAGISSGFSNFFANLGSLSFVYILGILKDTSGSFETGFFALAASCFFGLPFTVLLSRMRKKAIAQEALARESTNL